MQLNTSVDRKRNRRSVRQFFENWPYNHWWYHGWISDARQWTSGDGMWYNWQRYKATGNFRGYLEKPYIRNIICKISHILKKKQLFLKWQTGWLSRCWILPRWTVFKGSCSTLPKSPDEKSGYNGWTTSRCLWITKLSRWN